MKDLKTVVKETPELAEFFDEILSWMSENDYECGPHGSDIFERIAGLLDKSD